MAIFQIYKETTLPSPLQPHSVYLIAPTAKPDYVEMYVTGASASNVKRIIDEDDIQLMIDTALESVGSLEVVADITERDALTLTANTVILVLDATADTSVTVGAATYAYRHSDTSFTKISEYESLDVVLEWANIQNRPTSAVADIDDAVALRHTHTNKTELDKIGEDVDGKFTYNGTHPEMDWSSSGW